MSTMPIFRRTALLTAAIATLLRAQDGYTPICPAGKAPVVDTANVVYELSTATRYNGRSFTPEQLQQTMFYADAIRQRFVAPSSLGFMPVLAHASEHASEKRRKELDDPPETDFVLQYNEIARLLLVIRKDGRLKLAAWESQPRSVALANAIYAATQLAEAEHDFDGIPAPSTGSNSDTLVVVIRENATPNVASLALMRVQYPYYRDSEMADLVKTGVLTYPTTAAQAGVEIDGEVSYIIGSDGKAIEESMQVVRSRFRDFITPMMRAVMTSAYRPAMNNGCAVPMLIVQPFAFRLNR
jgi:hypothetical protein